MTPRTRLVLALILGGSAVLGACAPPPPGSLQSLESQARRGAERRARRFAVCDARGILRIDGPATGKLPGVSMRVRVASPDRVRFQISWLLGTLGDVAVRSDSLVAWVPSQRLALVMGGLADTLGVQEPARFLSQALSASWIAPREAWRDAVLEPEGVRLAWSGTAGESWTMRVDREGRPAEVRAERDGRSLAAKVSSWQGRGLEAWPSRLELTEGGGRVRVRLELEDLHAVRRPRASWFALMPPADARTLTLPDLRELLNAGGGTP